MARWLERYLAGDLVRVWVEITSLGADLRTDPADFEDAQAVARITMRRARRNVERLVEMLPAAGYRFAATDEFAAFEPPSTDIAIDLDVVEQGVGLLPLSLRAWYEEVGRVNLVGTHDDWKLEFTDALVVDAPISFVLSEHDQWADDQGTSWGRSQFTIDLSPDYLHKANVSGGAPYALAVPNPAGDGLLLWERHQTTFVNYLRLAFRNGGFTGWDRGATDDWAVPTTPPPAVLAEISHQLEAI